MIQREIYMDRILGGMDRPQIIKVITGIRGSGKSTMLELIRQELVARGIPNGRMIGLGFRDPDFKELLDPEKLHDHLKARLDSINANGERAYLFLDDVDEVEKWDACANSLLTTADVDIYATGSNAKILDGEWASQTPARHVEIPLYPFSFREFCVAIRQGSPEATDRELFDGFLKLGGMPGLADMGLGEGEAMKRLVKMYDGILDGISEHGGFRGRNLLESVVSEVIANTGNGFTATGISSAINDEKRAPTPKTVRVYLKGCEDAYLLHKLKRIDLLAQRKTEGNEKYYVADHSFSQAACGRGVLGLERVLENIVCLEMIRRGYEVSVGWVGRNQIDLVCEKSGERVYVQVCNVLYSKKIADREFGAYYAIRDNYPKYVVSMDEVDLGRDGFLHMNIRDFLLSQDF